jgi:lipid-A-disaccharide synthase
VPKATIEALAAPIPREFGSARRARHLVRSELARAAFDLIALPVRAGAYLAHRDAERAEFARALATTAAPDPVPACAVPRDRPLSIFISCAEASGEIHAINAVRALRARIAEQRAPAPRLCGLGGARLAAEGVEIADDVVRDARMGFSGVVRALPRYLDLLRRTVARLERDRPDVLLAVDSPALHVPLGRMARALGVPVVHFVTPQYWGWAPWRVAHYPGAVDLALSILPFEPAWFAGRGVRVAHVGHPLLDELAHVERANGDSGGEFVLLPGSRPGVVKRNLGWMLRTIEPLVHARTIPRAVIPCARAEIGELLRAEVARAGAADLVRIEAGELHGVLRRARAAFSVSGTVLLDLLHHDVPTTVVYRLGSRFAAEGKEQFLTAPWFASVNLLAGREVVPEFTFEGEGPRARVRAALAESWTDPAARARCRTGLAEARRRLGPPGATRRAAGHTLAVACRVGSAPRSGAGP